MAVSTKKMLAVWLPLTGDLHNQGCAAGTVNNANPTWNNNGKIGKCFFADGKDCNKTFAELTASKASNPTQAEQDGEIRRFTISLWLKVNSTNAHGLYAKTLKVGMLVKSNAAAGGITNISNFWIQRGTNDTVNTLGALYWDRIRSTSSGNTTDYYRGTSADGSNWTHIAVVCDGEYFRFYRNGVVDTAYKIADYLESYRLTGYVSIGTDNSLSCINDLRIFTYALSPSQVKELSLGKVGHWLGNDWTVEPRSNKYSANLANCISGWSVWNSQGYTINALYNLDGGLHGSRMMKATIPNGCTSWRVLISDYDFTVGKWYAFSCWVKGDSTSVGLTITFSHGANGITVSNASTTTITLTDKWQKVTSVCYVDSSTGSFHTGFGGGTMGSAAKDRTFYVTACMKEEASTVCPVFIPGGTSHQAFLSDISGFGRHGLVSGGGVTLSSDTKRYDKSLYLTGSDKITITEAMPTSLESCTINFWFKPDIGKTFVLYADIININNSKLRLEVCNTSGTKILWYGDTNMAGTANNFGKYLSTPNKEWYMITLVINNKVPTIYLNGANALTGTTLNNNVNLNTIVIGDSAGMYGNYSDIRLYATALDADDVKELYALGH